MSAVELGSGSRSGDNVVGVGLGRCAVWAHRAAFRDAGLVVVSPVRATFAIIVGLVLSLGAIEAAIGVGGREATTLV